MFTLYTSPLGSIVEQEGAEHGTYADDVNIISEINAASINDCAACCAAMALKDWYIRNGMMPNPSKSEAMAVDTPAQLAKFPKPLTVDVAGADILCSNSTFSLGVDIDSSLTFDKRVSSIVSACNYHLRALRHIRPALSEETAVTVGRAIILSRIDYCNSLLTSTSESNINRLQRLQNRLIRSVKRLPYRSHVS